MIKRKTKELNEIIENLCDWMQENNTTIRFLNVYFDHGQWHLFLKLRKEKDGKRTEFERTFPIDRAMSSKAWNEYDNKRELDDMLRELDGSEGK